METSDYIQNRINTNIRHFEELSKKYHRCHVGFMIAVFSCLFGVVILNVVYLIIPVIWLILASCVLVLAGLFLLFFDVLNDYSSKSLEYKYKANLCVMNEKLYQQKRVDLKVLRFVVKDLCSDYGGYNNRHFVCRFANCKNFII